MRVRVTTGECRHLATAHSAAMMGENGRVSIPSGKVQPTNSNALKAMAETELDPAIAARLKRNDAGLVPAIAQDAANGRVLMMAWMNDRALALTLATGRATYWSRSRQELWVKGETSGHTQNVRELWLDCDGDTILLSVDQLGPACHTGAQTCFDAGGRLPLAAQQPLDGASDNAAPVVGRQQ